MDKFHKSIIFLFLIFLVGIITYNVALAKDPAPTAASGVEFTNPLGKVDSVQKLLDAIVNNLRLIVGTIAVIFIIIGGVMYMMSAGQEKMMTKAKNTITAAIIGLAIAVAAPTFLNQINEIFGTGSGGPTLKTIAEKILDILLSIVGIIAIIALIIGGAMYMTAYGNEKRIDTSKEIIVAAIIGIIVCFGSLVIVKQVATIVGGS